MKILNSLNQLNYCLESLEENNVTAQQRNKLKRELKSLLKAESLLINDFDMGYQVEMQQTQQKTSKNREINFDDDDEFEIEDGLAQLEQINQNFLNFNHQYVKRDNH